MENGQDVERQLREIQHYLAETRKGGGGGIAIVGVWAALTLAALIVLYSGMPASPVWMIHNALGWAFTFAWMRHVRAREGRVSLRGRQILRLWAAVTLGLWVSVLVTNHRVPGAMPAASYLVPLWLATGIFGSGLIMESATTQVLGVIWMAGIGLLALLTPTALVNVALISSLIIAPLLWIVLDQLESHD